MPSKYPAGGVMFENRNKRSDKAPDLTGTIEFDAQQVAEMMMQLDQGKERAVMDLAGWKRRSQSGKNMLSVKVSKPWKQEDAQGRPPENAGTFPSPRQQPASADLDDDIPFSHRPWSLG